jgi:hypothetical protein
MDPSRKYDSLVQMLTRGTESRRINWEKTLETYTFRATLASGIVRVAKHHSTRAGTPPYSLTVVDLLGRVLDDFAPLEMKDAEGLARLYDLAKESALSMDSVIDDMLKELETKLA